MPLSIHVATRFLLKIIFVSRSTSNVADAVFSIELIRLVSVAQSEEGQSERILKKKWIFGTCHWQLGITISDSVSDFGSSQALESFFLVIRRVLLLLIFALTKNLHQLCVCHSCCFQLLLIYTNS